MNSEKISKIWKKSHLNSWIVWKKWYGKYGRKVSWTVKWYGKYGTKVSWIVKIWKIWKEKNCEKIRKIWRKVSESDKKWYGKISWIEEKIWNKSKLNSEMIWKIKYRRKLWKDTKNI